MSQKKDFTSSRKAITYLDLFAGAGGFSEGSLKSFMIICGQFGAIFVKKKSS